MEKMQFLISLFKLMLVSYIVVWAILLILCLRKKDFWPIIGDSRTTKYFWLVTFIFLNPALTVLYFIFGQIRSPIAKYNKFAFPVVLAFVIVGFRLSFPGLGHLWMQPFQGREKNYSSYHASLATIKSVNNKNTSSTSHTSDNSRLACKNVAVICEQDDILLNLVGNYLKDMIKEIPNIENVDYYNLNSSIQESTMSPDIFISLELNNFKENYLPYILKLQVGIHATISNHVISGGSGYIDSFTPPVINYTIDLDLTHKSETAGYESIKYDMASKDIAKQISEELEKNLKNWEKKYGLLPEIPEDFYGEYKVNELPEPFNAFHVEKLFSYSGFMALNETYLKMEIDEDVIEQLTQLQEQMEELGWKKLSGDLNERFLELRFEKEKRRLHIFKPREENPYRPGTYVINVEKEDKKKPTYLYIYDSESLPNQELYSALDKLLEEPVNMELVILFEKMFNAQQCDKYFGLLRSKPLNTLYSKIRIAEMYESRGMLEEAKQAFLHAKAMFWVLPETNEYRNRLETLAKKFGDRKLVQQAPERKVLLEMGAIEVTKDTEPFVIEAAPEENVVLFCKKQDGSLRTSCLSCTPLDESNQSFILNWAGNSNNNGKSWSTQNSNKQSSNSSFADYSDYDFDKGINIFCNITKDKNNDKYLMSFEIHKDSNK